MISRVAENLFWLARYVERAENTARALEATLSYQLDAQSAGANPWVSLITIEGELERFAAELGESTTANSENVQRYLALSRSCPVSIRSSLHGARENARTTRELTTRDMWETLNAFWLWLDSEAAERLFRRDRFAFYARIRENSAQFRGAWRATMLQDEAFHFMEIGVHLERAGQIARLLDMGHHPGSRAPRSVDSPEETLKWVHVLQSTSAWEGFFRTNRSVRGRRVARFLLLEPRFPRSVVFCLERTATSLEAIRPRVGKLPPASTARIITDLHRRLNRRTIDEMIEAGLDDELTGIINTVAAACDSLYADFFEPAFTGLENPVTHVRARQNDPAPRPLVR